MEEGEWLFYCDAGSYFVHSIQPLIDLAVATENNVLTFEDENLERKFSKRDAFLLLDADEPYITDTPQRIATFSLWRKSTQATEFATEWLHYACDHRIISDAKSALSQPEHPEFKAHRHDQSILSVLAKKHGIPAYRDPSQWGNSRIADYPNSPYPQLIELTRQRDVPWLKRLKRGVKGLLGFYRH